MLIFLLSLWYIVLVPLFTWVLITTSKAIVMWPDYKDSAIFGEFIPPNERKIEYTKFYENKTKFTNLPVVVALVFPYIGTIFFLIEIAFRMSYVYPKGSGYFIKARDTRAPLSDRQERLMNWLEEYLASDGFGAKVVRRIYSSKAV